MSSTDDMRRENTMFGGGFLFRKIRSASTLDQMQIIVEEREKELIGRFHSISIAETLSIKNF